MRPLLPLLALLVCVGAAVADEAANLRRDHQLLEAELQLARGGQLYIVFDLIDRMVMLRASGVTLSRLPISDLQFDGPVPAATPLILTGRETSSPPHRETIRIPETGIDNEEPVVTREEPTAEPLALELADMPVSYRLLLADGTRIEVGPIRSGFVTGCKQLGHGLRGLFGAPDTTRLQLTLAEADARQLYWSFADNAPCLVRTPAPH